MQPASASMATLSGVPLSPMQQQQQQQQQDASPAESAALEQGQALHSEPQSSRRPASKPSSQPSSQPGCGQAAAAKHTLMLNPCLSVLSAQPSTLPCLAQSARKLPPPAQPAVQPAGSPVPSAGHATLQHAGSGQLTFLRLDPAVSQAKPGTRIGQPAIGPSKPSQAGPVPRVQLQGTGSSQSAGFRPRVSSGRAAKQSTEPELLSDIAPAAKPAGKCSAAANSSAVPGCSNKVLSALPAHPAEEDSAPQPAYSPVQQAAVAPSAQPAAQPPGKTAAPPPPTANVISKVSSASTGYQPSAAGAPQQPAGSAAADATNAVPAQGAQAALSALHRSKAETAAKPQPGTHQSMQISWLQPGRKPASAAPSKPKGRFQLNMARPVIAKQPTAGKPQLAAAWAAADQPQALCLMPMPGIAAGQAANTLKLGWAGDTVHQVVCNCCLLMQSLHDT